MSHFEVSCTILRRSYRKFCYGGTAARGGMGLGAAMGEGNTEGALRRHALGENGGEAARHDSRLSRPGRSEHQQGTIKMVDNLLLVGVGISHANGGMVGFLLDGDKVKKAGGL